LTWVPESCIDRLLIAQFKPIAESQEDCFNQMASLGDCCKFCQHDPRFVWRIFRSSITGAFAVREILIFVLVRE